MRDNRFIELVNLYVDRQITAAETAELEAEIQASPRRRAVYRQYCQLHAASKQVYDSFRVDANGQASGHPAGRAVIEDFQTRRRSRGHWIHYVGGCAAAACLALLFVRMNSHAPSADGLAVEPAAVPAAMEVAAAVPAPVVEHSHPAPSLVSLRDGARAEPDYAALLTALRQEDQRAFASGQIQSGRLPSLFDDGVFASRPMNQPVNQRVFRGKQAPVQQAEFTAFQFQR